LGAGRDACPSDYFAYGGSTLNKMKYCLCCRNAKDTTSLHNMFNIYRIEPSYQKPVVTVAKGTIHVKEKEVQKDKYCKQFHKISDDLVPLTTCGQMTYATNECTLGNGYYIHPGQGQYSKCYCCTNENALTNAIDNKSWNIY
jgi:hypothetical protein